MYRPVATRRLAVLVLSALIATAMGLQQPAPARAGGDAGGGSSAQSSGDAGCIFWIQGAPCQDWSTEKPAGNHDWIYVDEASYAASGSSLSTRQSFDVHEEYTIGGSWRSTTLTGTMTASNSGGGKAGNDLSYDLAIETPGPQVSVTGTISAVAEGSEYVLGIAEATVLIECGGVEFEFDREVDAGAGYDMSDSGSYAPSGSVDSDGNSCDIEFDAGVGATTNQKAPGNAGSVSLEFNLTFSSNVIEGCDGFEGIVTDGAEPEAHVLNGVRVQLHRNGSPVGEPVATAEDGFYCMPASESVPPGDYQVRATLIDQLHQPPLFDTRLTSDAAAAFAEVPVHADTFGGSEQVQISFADPARSWVSRVANIHYEAERFVRWLTDTLGWSPNTIRPFVIRAYDDRSTQYLRGPSEVLISTNDSALTARDQASDIAPDNAEWHEIGHHIAASFGIASPTAPACFNRVNHAGWLNPSTCDSIGEGFPMFLAVLGSLAIDAGREGGYATTNYAGMVDLEAHGLFAWSVQYSDDNSVSAQREDMAVAQLLWDLADDTPTEAGRIYLAGPDEAQLTLHDEIAIGGSELVDLMATFQVNTVEDLYRAAAGSTLIPAEAATPSVDIDNDGEPDISALDAVFLLHGFHPVEDQALPSFRLGDAFPRTDHVPAGPGTLVPRSHVEQVAGSFIRLQNGTAEAVTFSAEVAGLDGGAPFQVSASVPANSTDLLYLEVAPYYRSILSPGHSLPPCDASGVTPRQISITAPGVDTKILDSCEYLHLVVDAVDGAALTVTVGSGSFGATAAPTTSGTPPVDAGPVNSGGPGVPVVAAVVVVAVVALLGFLVLRRRRSAASAR